MDYRVYGHQAYPDPCHVEGTEGGSHIIIGLDCTEPFQHVLNCSFVCQRLVRCSHIPAHQE